MEKSQDPDFGCGGMVIVTSDLSKAPYYAVQIAPAIYHAMGGVEVKTNSEVLDKDGNAVTDIVVFGRNTAKHVEEYLTK